MILVHIYGHSCKRKREGIWMALAERILNKLIKQFDYYILSIRLIYSYSLFFCLFSFQFHDDINFPPKIYELREDTNIYQFQFFICNLSQNVPLAILVFQTYRFVLI